MRGWGRLGVAKKGNSFIAFFSIFSIEFFYSMRAKLSLYKCWRPQLEKNKKRSQYISAVPVTFFFLISLNDKLIC